jgi:hypothetical protein
VKEKFSHDLQKLYEALPADQRVLTGTELEVLRTATMTRLLITSGQKTHSQHINGFPIRWSWMQ